jgi:FMN phosphatase YigB (HAD superfamily)
MKAIIFDFNRTLYDPDTGTFVEGALQTLEKLKKRNFLLFLIGKGTAARADLINELGLPRFFDEIIVKEEKEIADFRYLKKKYPDADFYVFGDRVKKEIRFGNECGFKTIWFKNGKFAEDLPETGQEKPWKIAADYGELEKALE